MAAYNKELRDSNGVDIIYPVTKAENVYLSDNKTNIEAALPDLTVNGEKTKKVNIFAPTNSGVLGQMLISGGDGEPTWGARAASSTHTHNITGTETATALKLQKNGEVVQGAAATYTGHSFTANVPTKIDVNKFDGGTQAQFTQGNKASWSATVNEEGLLKFSWTTNGNDSFTPNSIASLNNGFYTEGTPATHTIGEFNGGKATEVTMPTFLSQDVITSVGSISEPV